MASTSGPERVYLQVVKRLLWWSLVVVLVYWTAAWSWGQPFMAIPRTNWELTRLPPPTALPVPVQGVRATGIADTFGAPRGTERTHAGVDIFAKRGTPVHSATRGLVTSVREGGLGGRQVWVLGPARERHYYAHLEDWQAGLKAGDVVEPGTPLGRVGTSGNARGTPPHLHYGIYGAAGAYNPLPLFLAYDHVR